MRRDAPHITPSVYLADCLDDFEELVASYPARRRTYRKGGFLTQRGVINNTAFFVRGGIIQLSLGHDKGSVALDLFGPGTVFPVGVETEYLMEQETIIRAFSDVEACAMPYPTLRRIAVEHGDSAGELLRENCDLIGYLFFGTLNQAILGGWRMARNARAGSSAAVAREAKVFHL